MSVIGTAVGAALTLVAVLVCLGVTGYVWRRRALPGAVPFAAVTVAAATLGVVDVVRVALRSPSTALLGVREGVALLLPVAWVMFALTYTGRAELVTRWSVLGASLPAAASVPLVGTGARSALWSGPCRDVPATGVGVGAACSPGEWFLVHVVCWYVLVAVGAWLVLRSDADREGVISHGGAAPARTVTLLGGLLPPVVGQSLPLTGAGSVAGVDLRVAGVAVTGVVWGYVLFRSDLLGVVPGTSRLGERSVVDDLSDSVVVVDGDDRVVTMNDAAAETFDRTVEAVRGDRVDGPIGTDLDVSPGVTVVETETATGRRSLEVTISEVEGADGRRAGHALVVRDVTDRIQREQQLEALNRVLRHNLRNDMNVVQGWADTLADRLTGEEATMADEIENNAATLLELGGKVRQIERVTDAETDPEPFELAAELRAVAEAVREDHDRGRVDVRTEGTVRLRANRRVVRTVVRNLVENGVEHAGSESPEVTVVARPDSDDWVEVTVSDDGPGIPDHELETLRAGEETALRHGSGLGLWVVEWGVTALGGDVEFVTDADGTTVHVRLPGRVTPETGPQTVDG